jgi:hypothetical protein
MHITLEQLNRLWWNSRCHFTVRVLQCTSWTHSAARQEKTFTDKLNVLLTPWPRLLKYEISLPAQTLGSRVRIPLEAYSVLVLSCADSGLTTGSTPSQGSYLLCKIKETEVKYFSRMLYAPEGSNGNTIQYNTIQYFYATSNVQFLLLIVSGLTWI